jgi:hypothetical protein
MVAVGAPPVKAMISLNGSVSIAWLPIRSTPRIPFLPVRARPAL